MTRGAVASWLMMPSPLTSPSAMMKRAAGFGTAIALSHLAISLLHGRAHHELRISLTAAQTMFALTVITVGPLLAMLLLWTALHRLGFALLFASMAGSLIFGAYNHFAVASPDHVAHVPPGPWGTLFQVTAVLLAVTEALGLFVGLRFLRGGANQ